jgi:YfiH family protein
LPLIEQVIHADLPPAARGFSTTRAGGCSSAAFESLNLGSQCGDQAAAVAENRRRLAAVLPGPPHWLRQVHGARVIHLDEWKPGVEADAAWTDRPSQVAAVLTADCLPILIAEASGSCVAAVHAGWRGLARNIIAATIDALPARPEQLHAWIGPAIGPAHYPVGPEVVDAFAGFESAFRPRAAGQWQADLPAIAMAQLRRVGLVSIRNSALCSFADPRFFSVRRDRETGRFGSLVWLAPGQP